MTLMHKLEQAHRPEKVIVITAYGSAENAVEALKAGAFDYLTKPLDVTALLRCLDEQLASDDD